MSIIDTLVFDRTSADVEEVKTLRDKILAQGFDSLTPAEKTKYLGCMKGAYNYTDMNRVGEAISYVVNRGKTLELQLTNLIHQYGLEDNPIYHLGIDTSIVVTPKTTWTKGDTPTGDECKHYIEEIGIIHNMLPDVAKPDIPVNMDYLTHINANNIEENLYIVDKSLEDEYNKKEELIKHSGSGLRKLAFVLSRKWVGNRRVS